MPAEFTVDTLPTPSDPRIRVREIPTQLAAARTFTGRWSEQIYSEQLAELHSAASQAGLEFIGQPRFARFDPPWTPWFLRHNEVVQPVAADPVPLSAVRCEVWRHAQASRRPQRIRILIQAVLERLVPRRGSGAATLATRWCRFAVTSLEPGASRVLFEQAESTL